MNEAARRRLIEELCESALEREPPERAAFLAAACGTDEGLRRDVEALLAHAETAEGFLAVPVAGLAAQIMAERPQSLVGRTIASHSILALLGVGGMGQVYRARDAKLGRDVAIKVIADRFLSDPVRLARFEREARVLATLNHPHIGAIYGIEEAGGIRALVLELVEGETLADRIAAGPLPIREALTIARQIADAIEAAHEKGIIHRDLKPANIKMTPAGIVKVLDFGLAKVFAPDGPGAESAHGATATMDGTQEGVIAGTAAYMSPEQARGLSIDKRTDLWAFGCVLYQMVTGRVPFPGETTSDTIARILEHEPDWAALPADIPASIHRLLRRCLEKDAKRRLRDIGDARLDIDEALGAPSGHDPNHERAEREHSRPSARPARVAWAMAAVALLAGAGTAAMWYRQDGEPRWRDPLEGAKFSRLTDYPGAEQHAAISKDGQFVAFLWDGDGIWDAWVTQVGTGDTHNRTNGRLPELRNPATRTLGFSPDGSLVMLWSRVQDPIKGTMVSAGRAVPTMGGELQSYLQGLDKGISELDWSPDGKHLVYHPPSDGDPLWVTDLDGLDGRQIHEAPAGVHCHFPVWSADGFIYFVKGAVAPLEEWDIWRIRPAGGTPERLTFHNSRVSFPVLLDSRTLLYLATDEDGSGPWMYTIDLELRLPARKIHTDVEEYTSLAAAADGRRLVATESRTTSTLWQVRVGDGVRDASAATQVALPTATGLSPRIGPGFLIYRAPIAGTPGLYKTTPGMDSGNRIPASSKLRRDSDGRALGRAAVSHDGQRVAFVERSQGRSQLYIVNSDWSGLRRVAGDLDVRGAPAWSPDDRWIAIAAANQQGMPQLHKIPVDGGQPQRLVSEYSTDPTWSPSGQFLVYSDADVGTTFFVKAVNADGSPRHLPELKLTRGARRLAFTAENTLVTLKGNISHKEFWSVDLRTGREQQLTKLGRGFVIGDFDLSADGREIFFDRIHEESDIVLIDLPKR